jgi:ribosomal protein S18 acetylase RimI-like enzyme
MMPAITVIPRELTVQDVDRLPLGLWSRLTAQDVRNELESFPCRSVWLPDTLEYAILGPWRRRPEIANVLALSAARHPAELLIAAARQAHHLGARIVTAIEIDEVRHPAFYEKAGFKLLEEIITYELDLSIPLASVREGITFRYADISDSADIEQLLALDHASFPWLWWNSAEEFNAYGSDPGVELFVGYVEDQAVSYIGITAYLGWGHIDRIAVSPSFQGRGYGEASLAFAISRLAQSGAKRVGLSTQQNNQRSQRLYERFGFRRSSQNGYRIYGKIMNMPEEVNDIVRAD